MPREYKPVEVKAVQWAKVFKLIEAEGTQGIAVRDLAERLGMDRDPISPELEKSIELLRRQDRIRVLMGRDSTGMVTRVVQALRSEPTKRYRENDDGGRE